MATRSSPPPANSLDALYRLFVQSQPSVPADWQAQGDHAAVTLRIQRVESLAARISEWIFMPAHAVTWTADQLRDLGDAFCREVTYLLEPLRVVEFDPAAASLQARSAQPSTAGNQRAYFELLLSSHSATLRRFAVQSGSLRQQQDMQLTHEVVQRLLLDIERILGSL